MTDVDFVCVVDAIGDPGKIATGAAKPTSDQRKLLMAEYCARFVAAEPHFKDGFVYQTGAGGALLHLEGAEAHELHLLLLVQGGGDGAQGGGDDSLGVLLGHAGLFRHGGDQFGLIHDSPPKNFPWSKSIPKR